MVAAGRAVVNDGSFMIESLWVVLGVGGAGRGVGFFFGVYVHWEYGYEDVLDACGYYLEERRGRKWEVQGGSFGICSERGEWPLGRSWQDGLPCPMSVVEVCPV